MCPPPPLPSLCTPPPPAPTQPKVLTQLPPPSPPPPSHIYIPVFICITLLPSSLLSRSGRGVLLPAVLKLNLHIVQSLLSLLLLGHLAGNVGIHGNPEKWHWLLGEYQYRQASINIPVTHYQSNGEAALLSRRTINNAVSLGTVAAVIAPSLSGSGVCGCRCGVPRAWSTALALCTRKSCFFRWRRSTAGGLQRR